MNIAPVSINGVYAKDQNEYYNPDKLPEIDFNDIGRIVSEICNTPASLVCIIDINRQWIKPLNFIKSVAIPHDFPFWGNGSIPGDVFVVPDLSDDKRFRDHIYVAETPNALFYAGITLVNCEGGELGMLCVLDTECRQLEDKQKEALKNYAKQVACMLELSRKATKLKEKQAELKMAYADLSKIASLASHDLRSPVNNIISITHLLKEDYGTKLDADGTEYIDYLNDAAYHLSDLISGVLSYSKLSLLSVAHKEHINIPELIAEVNGLLNIPQKIVVKYPKEGSVYTSRIALKQILLHLFHNAIRYNTKNQLKIEVIFNECDAAYNFEVKDNGPGIAEEDHEKIFELFEKLQGATEGGRMGIDLAIVKRLVEKLGGEINVHSELDKGAAFVFTIPK